MSDDEICEMIDVIIARLGEHLDAVQILGSRPRDGGGTEIFLQGNGNYYARQGMAHEFLNQTLAQDNASQLAAALKKDDE